jgi:hypothetical protein
LAAAKAHGASYVIPDEYLVPPPRVWPYPIAEAEAEMRFQAGCRAAHDAATSREVHAQAAHDPISVIDEVGGSPLIAGWPSGLAHDRPEPKQSKPLPELELAASTMNPKYAARMLGYDLNVFKKMLHLFKPENGLNPNDNVQFYDNGDIFFQGQYVGNIHDFSP